MSARSPFERIANLPTLTELKNPRTSGEHLHVAVNGLLGASRTLGAGALSLARAESACGVTLIVVDGPEAALDAIADLRAFVAVHESLDRSSASTKKAIRNDAWADAGKGSERFTILLESALFPAWDVLPTETDKPEGLTLAGRRRATDRLRDFRTAPSGSKESYCLIAPVTALLQPCESPSQIPADIIVLKSGGEHDPIMLGRKLSESGYDRVGQVEVRGEFALRGGILDIFPYTSELPYRIDFFGDTIESIKPFDPISQRSEDAVDSIQFANASPASLKKLFSPGASSGPFSLLDHLPPGALIVFHEPQRLRQRAELYSASLVSGNSIHFELEDLLGQAKKKCDTLQLIGDIPQIQKNSGDSADDDGDGDEHPAPPTESFDSLTPSEPTSVECRTLQRLEGEVSTHAGTWKRLIAERDQVLVFCETPGDRQRLGTLLKESGIAGEGLRLVLGKLSREFDLREAGFAAISGHEIFGRTKHAAAKAPERKKQPAGTVAIQHLMDLHLGDYVVHAAHGIARYLGLARLEKSGRTEDYLTLLFANEVKLYVPAAHIGWVSKYIGGHSALELSTLGGKAWARKKERAAKAIRDIAEDLLKVQAARHSLPGIVYPPDGEWQAPFEEAFPFDETADQLTAIEAVKKDMEATCPMDRLICGDVGFGKTEVALRAAFKAVGSGKQVAVLAPTTLLAEQHGRTFTERFAGYPFHIDVLSRFKSPREQKQLLEKVSTGRVDVVIGTHRLLQKDVRFKDLGLAIVDEEQRFGVEHKEFFKQLRKSVDVLTLTATPIPRTLHMALLGLRDISNLTTPPRNRRSITTKVARVSDDLLRRSILREISRGGQVFVVHPRVRDIEEFRIKLAELVPEARFAVGHGQMDPDALEDVMARFLHGNVDVLVSTTIVESGLDIPSANTILIHEAGNFGLSELHQLRGRVGRSDVQAYCYLLLPERTVLTPEGLRRLRALEEFDELGAGFQLALKDLEIRGAGNVLGRQQSGEIAEIGYDLYCRLLDATVKDLQGEPAEESIEVNLQLRGAAYIPEEYVQDDKVVLEFYRRLDSAGDDREIDSLKGEMIERFGPLPPPASRMFDEAKLRRLARAGHVPYLGLDNEEGRIILKLHGWDLKVADLALRGIPEAKGVRVLDGETFSFGLTLKARHDEVAMHAIVRRILEPLAQAFQAQPLAMGSG